MSVVTVSHKFFERALGKFNQARMKSLLHCAEALLSGGQLSLTSIGRNLSGSASVRHKIKRVDRLLGNDYLHEELPEVYASLAQKITALLPYCVIAVDWSGCCRPQYHVLRASLLVEGRSIPLINRVVKEEEQENPQVHESFLDELSIALAGHTAIYLITDGGFKTPWLQKVNALGWHYIARVRGRILGRIDNGTWQTVQELTSSASAKSRSLGYGQLGKTSSSQIEGYFHVAKRQPKGRKKVRARHRPLYPDAEASHRKAAVEPWLILTSDGELTSNAIVNLYGKRMQIEQNFRDDKSEKYGFGWRASRTMGVERIGVLCLIAAIASTLLWLLGYYAERHHMHLKFQANSIKTRRVLSFLTVAKNMMKHMPKMMSVKTLSSSLKMLAQHYNEEMRLCPR